MAKVESNIYSRNSGRRKVCNLLIMDEFGKIITGYLAIFVGLFLGHQMVAAAGLITPNIVVSPPGSPGQFHSISEAINAAPDHYPYIFLIYIRAGVYAEYVVIPREKRNIKMAGDGFETTIITGSRSNADGFGTSSTATFIVSGDGFIGQDLSFVNTAGPHKGQAVAFHSDADWTVLYRCSVRGYQDSLYAHSGRHFYKRCEIEGTVDFIFGRAAAVFQDCRIVALRGMPGQKNTITAQGRESSTEWSGFTLQFCDIIVAEGVLESGTDTYLGRPWKLYSTVVVMESTISGAISPQGWYEWNGSFALDTLYYGEYMNVGPGADVSHRVGWKGFQVITDPRSAFNFTVAHLLSGDAWLPCLIQSHVHG